MDQNFNYKIGQKIQITRSNSLLFNAEGEKGIIEKILPEEKAIVAEVGGYTLKLYPMEFQVIQDV